MFIDKFSYVYRNSFNKYTSYVHSQDIFTNFR